VLALRERGDRHRLVVELALGAGREGGDFSVGVESRQGRALAQDLAHRLDLVVGAVHSKFGLSRELQTERIIRAMDNRYFNILAHPSGRLIGEREAYAIDIERLIAAARARGCFFELNAQPERLDLTDLHCRLAKNAGLKLAVSTDAHSTFDLGFVRFGIDQARRGWLEKKDVVNAASWKDLQRMLRR